MKYSVLVVDDERLIAKNIARNIEEMNHLFEVEEILSCGTDALEYVRKQIPNVVFTDIRMPEMDGLELAHKISKEFPFITCVIISGYNDFAYAKQAMEYHVSNYLLKPINKKELQDCLASLERQLQAQHPNLENALEEKEGTFTPEEIVDLVKEYICKNYSSPISLSSIANNLGFSAAYLSKVFSKQTGNSPSRYLKEYRITVAKQLLNNAHLSIATVSSQTGFVDQFHFSKTFKHVTGINPTEYRKSLNPSESPLAESSK